MDVEVRLPSKRVRLLGFVCLVACSKEGREQGNQPDQPVGALRSALTAVPNKAAVVAQVKTSVPPSSDKVPTVHLPAPAPAPAGIAPRKPFRAQKLDATAAIGAVEAPVPPPPDPRLLERYQRYAAALRDALPTWQSLAPEEQEERRQALKAQLISEP